MMKLRQGVVRNAEPLGRQVCGDVLPKALPPEMVPALDLACFFVKDVEEPAESPAALAERSVQTSLKPVMVHVDAEFSRLIDRGAEIRVVAGTEPQKPTERRQFHELDVGCHLLGH